MKDINANAFGYVVVTDYVEANTGKDVSEELQKIINENPHRTIYFPDGEYILSKPICTSANPVNAVSLELSKFATLKASKDWTEKEAIVRLGAAEPFNTITVNGSNYGIIGGIIDGSGVANGVSVDSGRETLIREVSIKNTQIGIHIKHGANSNSSDADIMNVNIVGNGQPESIGVLIEGCDNTFTNMRIAHIEIGFKILAPSQFLKNLHPLYTYDAGLAGRYAESCAFWDDTNHEVWYNKCYSDQFSTGFRMKDGARLTYADCFCYWYKADGLERGFKVDGKFNSIIRDCRVHFNRNSNDNNAYITVAEEGGHGFIENPITERVTDETYKQYLVGRVI